MGEGKRLLTSNKAYEFYKKAKCRISQKDG